MHLQTAKGKSCVELSTHLQREAHAVFKCSPLFPSNCSYLSNLPRLPCFTGMLRFLSISNWHNPRCVGLSTESFKASWGSAVSYFKTQLPWLIQRLVQSELNWVCSLIVSSNSDDIIWSLLTCRRYVWGITGRRIMAQLWAAPAVGLNVWSVDLYK